MVKQKKVQACAGFFCVSVCRLILAHTLWKNCLWRERDCIEQRGQCQSQASASLLCVAPTVPEIRPQAHKLEQSCQGALHGTGEGRKMALCGTVSLSSTASDSEAPGASQNGAVLCVGVYIWYQDGGQNCGKVGRLRRINPAQSVCCRLKAGGGMKAKKPTFCRV